jgi:hypothetical protein
MGPRVRGDDAEVICAAAPYPALLLASAALISAR